MDKLYEEFKRCIMIIVGKRGKPSSLTRDNFYDSLFKLSRL